MSLLFIVFQCIILFGLFKHLFKLNRPLGCIRVQIRCVQSHCNTSVTSHAQSNRIHMARRGQPLAEGVKLFQIAFPIFLKFFGFLHRVAKNLAHKRHLRRGNNLHQGNYLGVFNAAISQRKHRTAPESGNFATTTVYKVYSTGKSNRVGKHKNWPRKDGRAG